MMEHAEAEQRDLSGQFQVRCLNLVKPLIRSLMGIGLAIVVFGIFLAITGRNPIIIYAKLFSYTFGSTAGLSEVGVLMIPFLLTGLAATIPAWVGLINVGGQGQLYLGAWAATGVVLYSNIDSIWLMLPAMAIAGSLGGALWAAIPTCLRQWRDVNEVISTLLLNFVAGLFVNIFVFGPWKSSVSYGYPYTPNFSATAILASIGSTRLHWGFIVPLLAVAACYFVFGRTTWGYNMRAVGGNVNASVRRGIPVTRYIVVAMLIGGAFAGLAGMIQVAGIHRHLRPDIDVQYGTMGFLASWLAGHDPVLLLGTTFLLSSIMVGGDLLQISANFPSAGIYILIGLVFFCVLGFRRLRVGAK
jgi:simple sugar transport system permease protein